MDSPYYFKPAKSFPSLEAAKKWIDSGYKGKVTKYPGWVTDIIVVLIIIGIVIISPLLWFYYTFWGKSKFASSEGGKK